MREAEKEEVMEPSHSQTADNPTKPKVMSPACKDPYHMGGTPGKSWC